jgi:hypothetical protein
MILATDSKKQDNKIDEKHENVIIPTLDSRKVSSSEKYEKTELRYDNGHDYYRKSTHISEHRKYTSNGHNTKAEESEMRRKDHYHETSKRMKEYRGYYHRERKYLEEGYFGYSR